jgi:hypothetical protein
MLCGAALWAGAAFAQDTGVTAPGSGAVTVAVGSPITVKKPVNLAQLAKSPKRFVGKTVRLEGTVKEVCQGRGCWVEVVDAKGASFLAKSLDESILLPMDCAGRAIVVQGVVTKLMAQGHDHEHGDGKVAEGHACPAPKYLVSTQGAVLK